MEKLDVFVLRSMPTLFAITEKYGAGEQPVLVPPTGIRSQRSFDVGATVPKKIIPQSTYSLANLAESST